MENCGTLRPTALAYARMPKVRAEKMVETLKRSTRCVVNGSGAEWDVIVKKRFLAIVNDRCVGVCLVCVGKVVWRYQVAGVKPKLYVFCTVIKASHPRYALKFA